MRHDVAMHHVVAKLDALDPEAGAAIRVISRFDELVEGRAGLSRGTVLPVWVMVKSGLSRQNGW